MIRLKSVVLGTALLAGAAGGAYAQSAQQPGTASAVQVSALPRVKMEPKPGGSEYTESTHNGIPAGYNTKQWDMRPSPGGQNTESTHFVKPAGYDQNPWMHPYASGEKPS
jgi:hypothetical protein